MASVTAEVYKEDLPAIELVVEPVKNIQYIIYSLIVITVVLFIKKLVVTFVRRRDNQPEAKFE